MAESGLDVLARVALPLRNGPSERVLWKCPVCTDMLILANNKSRHLSTKRHLDAAESMGHEKAAKLCEDTKSLRF